MQDITFDCSSHSLRLGGLEDNSHSFSRTCLNYILASNPLIFIQEFQLLLWLIPFLLNCRDFIQLSFNLRKRCIVFCNVGFPLQVSVGGILQSVTHNQVYCPLQIYLTTGHYSLILLLASVCSTYAHSHLVVGIQVNIYSSSAS